MQIKKNILFLSFLLVALCSVACGQNKTRPSDKENSNQPKQSDSDKRVENLKIQANDFYLAMLNNDLEKVKKFVYFPRIMTESNSPDEIDTYKERNAKEFTGIVYGVKDLFSQIKAKVNAKVNKPTEIVSADHKQIYSLVPVDLIGKTDKDKCVIRDFRLGISQENGQTWEFMRGDSTYNKGFKTFFPEAAKKIKLPDTPGMKCSEIN